MYDNSSAFSVFKDFLFENWVYQLPKVIGANLILFFIYLCTDANTWVDFGWCLNHWIIGISLMLQYLDKNTYKTCKR